MFDVQLSRWSVRVVTTAVGHPISDCVVLRFVFLLLFCFVLLSCLSVSVAFLLRFSTVLSEARLPSSQSSVSACDATDHPEQPPHRPFRQP